MGYDEYKNKVNRTRDRNFRFVTVKDTRVCLHCKEKISVGSQCLSIYPKYKGRHYLCETCISLWLHLKESKSLYDSVPFDDEGGSMAAFEAYDDARTEFLCRQG